MKIRVVSDLHLEFHPQYKLPVDGDEKDMILILAGDICTMNRLELYEEFFADISKRFHKILYVFGNHEFYQSQMDDALGAFSVFKSKFENIEFTSRGKEIIIDNVKFIMATLWTDFNHPQTMLHSSNEYSMFFYKKSMGDFFVIKDEDNVVLTPAKTKEFHRKQLMFIIDCLRKKETEKVVVITHHAPSFQSIHVRFWKDPLNPAFSSDLSKIIREFSPDLWIHGHMHDCFNYMEHDTRVICNPHGYGYENPSFNPTLTIELS